MSAVRTEEVAPLIPVAEARLHMRVDHDAEDPLIESLVQAATEYGEEYTWRAFVAGPWKLTLNRFEHGPIRLPRPPLKSVEAVKYIDRDGQEQTLAVNDDYRVDVPGGLVVPVGGWPNADDRPGAVTIEFTAGYGTPDKVPEVIRSAVKLKATDLYEHRGSQVTGSIVSTYATAAERLFDLYSAREFV